MKVLFFEDPLTDSNTLFWRNSHLRYDASVAIGLRREGIEVRVLMDERQIPYSERCGLTSEAVIGVRESAWSALLEDPHLNINTLFQRFHAAEGPAGVYARTLAKGIAEVLREALGSFCPDVIFTWVPAPFLREMFSHALILHREAAAFTRAPWPLTYFLDPCGLQGRSWPALHEVPLPSHPAVDNLRLRFASGLGREPPAVDVTVMQRFRRTVLVVGQVNGHFSFDASVSHRSQAQFLLEVLEHAPTDCAVLFAEHPNTPRRLTFDEVDWLSRQFKNFILVSPGECRNAPSQRLALTSDVTVTSTSSVGWQALFWDRRLVSPGKSQYQRIADSRNVKELASLLDDGADVANRAQMAHWLVFHYSIAEKRLHDGTWFVPYLRGRVDHWSRFGSQGYYDEPYESISSITRVFVSAARESAEASSGRTVPDASGRYMVDMRDDRHFAAGWSYAESNGEFSYRWTVGTKATFRCLLSHSGPCRLSLEVGTHAACEDQEVTLVVAGRQYFKQTINGSAHIEIVADLPIGVCSDEVLEFVLTASEARTPLGDPRALSLIVSRIIIFLPNAAGAGALPNRS